MLRVRQFEDRAVTLMRIAPGFKSHVRARTVATLLLLGSWSLLAGAAPAEKAPCVPAKPGEKMRVDFREVSLETVGRYVSCAAEIGLVYSPSELRSRTITVVAPNPVSVSGLVRLFESALKSHGLFLEARGSFHVIREGR